MLYSYIYAAFMWQCDFEVNRGAASWCSMEQNPGNNFRWRLIEGATPSVDTGPESASSGRYYIFAEASQPILRGDQSRLGSHLYCYNICIVVSSFCHATCIVSSVLSYHLYCYIITFVTCIVMSSELSSHLC